MSNWLPFTIENKRERHLGCRRQDPSVAQGEVLKGSTTSAVNVHGFSTCLYKR